MDENPEVELNQKQISLIEEFKKVTSLTALQDSCEEFQTDFEHLENDKNEHLIKQQQLIERLNKIKEELKKVYIEERDLKDKLDAIKTSAEPYDNSLRNICLLLGFQLSKWYLLELHKVDKTVLYDNGLDVNYKEIKNLFENIAAYPEHPEIVKIREFITNSQNLEGVVKSLKSLFVSEPMEVE